MSDLLNGVRANAVINALSGVAYLADEEGVILAFSRDALHAPHWGLVRADPGETYIGKSLFSMIRAGEVRDACRALHQAVWVGRLPTFGFEHRCDEPEMKRTMRMSVSLVADEARPVAVLYQSLLVQEAPRPAMGLFDPEAMTEPEEAGRKGPMVTLCTYCHAVAWPIGGPSADWIEPGEYYRRGGPDDVAVSHGICPGCYTSVVEPPLLALMGDRAGEA